MGKRSLTRYYFNPNTENGNRHNVYASVFRRQDERGRINRELDSIILRIDRLLDN